MMAYGDFCPMSPLNNERVQSTSCWCNFHITKGLVSHAQMVLYTPWFSFLKTSLYKLRSYSAATKCCDMGQIIDWQVAIHNLLLSFPFLFSFFFLSDILYYILCKVLGWGWMDGWWMWVELKFLARVVVVVVMHEMMTAHRLARRLSFGEQEKRIRMMVPTARPLPLPSALISFNVSNQDLIWFCTSSVCHLFNHHHLLAFSSP